MGITFKVDSADQSNEKRYEKFRGYDVVWTHARHGRDVGYIFFVARVILSNILAKGYRVLLFTLHVTTGEKPSGGEE